MKSRGTRLLCLALALLAPLITAAHVEVSAIHDGAVLEAHDHGPYTPCPGAAQPHCLACVSALLLPPPEALRLVRQTVGVTAAPERAQLVLAGLHRPASYGRSPPVS